MMHKTLREDNRKNRIRLTVLLAVVFVASVFFAWWLTVRTDRGMREDLLQQARLVAGAVNIEHVRALTGTEADLDSPDYLRLKEQFGAVSAANPKCRFVYLMGRRADGTVFFYADSEPAGSEDESPAGQVYEEISADYLIAFDTKTALTVGPVTDRWGTWVSSLVPLIDPQNGEFITVLGMDIDARTWKWDVAGRAAMPVGLVLLAMILVITIVLLRERTSALGVSELKYRHLFEGAAEGIVIVRSDTIDFANPALEHILGYALEKLIAKPFIAFIHPDDQAKVVDRHYRRMRGEVVERGYDFRVIASDGTVKWVTINSQLIQWESAPAILSFITDITERKQAEKKVHEYTMELELKGIELEQLYRQIDAEIDKARVMHERTLPKNVPHIEGLSLHTYYQPAQRMGGDFYNTIQADNKLALYISDVSGHGLEGALLSSFVKATIDSYVSLKPNEIDPGNIMYHLNVQYRRENYPDDYFVCIILMVLDLNSMELTYTGAGFQDLPLVKIGNGKKMRLHAGGPPISSAIPEEIMDFTIGKIILSPGTTVLISTDGLTEQQAGEEQYNGRLEQVFYEHSHLPPEIIMNSIKEDFCRFNGGSMQGDDDITLGIIQVEPKEKRELYLELESNFDALSFMSQAVSKFISGTEAAELFLIGLHELAANAMEHGNGLDPEKKVYVELVVSSEYIQASVEDQGPGFNWQEKIDHPLDLEGHSERGRGMAMTRICCDHLVYNEKGNRVIFVVEPEKGGK